MMRRRVKRSLMKALKAHVFVARLKRFGRGGIGSITGEVLGVMAACEIPVEHKVAGQLARRRLNVQNLISVVHKSERVSHAMLIS